MKVSLHPEVAIEVGVNVARSADEAELQAQGKSLIQLAAEAEAADRTVDAPEIVAQQDAE